MDNIPIPYLERNRPLTKNWRKRIGVFLAALLVASGVSAVASQPASASGTCYSGYTCFYWDIGYNGSSLLYYSGFRGQCVNVPWNWVDQISSMQNNIGADIIMYDDYNCSGRNLWYWNGGSIGDMRAWGFNDNINSVYFYP